MLFELFLFLFLGVLAGTLTGLTPGIHINLIGAILVSYSGSLLLTHLFFPILPIYLIVFIVSMSITHTFVDFIPSIFLGAPDDADTGLSTLPGHELLKEGRGYEAIMLSNYGSLIAILILILLFIPLIFIIPKIYPFLTKFMAFILIFFSLTLILFEKNKFSALFVFFITGFLGLIVLNLDIKEPLLPLLTGLFGSSMIILSIKQKTKIPKQHISNNFKVPLKNPIISSLIASPLCGFLPGLGGGQAAVIGSQISKLDKREFIVLIGIVNTLIMEISFISLYTINKARTGSAVSIQQLLGTFSTNILILILIISTISGIFAFYITKSLSKFFANKINKINYSILSIIVLIIISTVTLIFSGFFGFIILILSTLTGIYCSYFNIRRTTYMGCLLIPTIVLYLV